MAFGKTLTSIGMGLALLSQAGIASAQTTSASRLSVANAIPADARVGASVRGNHLHGTALIVAGLAAAVAIAAIIVATDNNDNSTSP